VSARGVARLELAAALALLIVGIWLRARHLAGPDFGFDEFYHVFAAKSLLEGGGLEIAEGRPYHRASLVTVLTAAAFALFGTGEAQARLPALAAGVLLLPVVYLIGRWLFGPVAALVALALTALSPDLIDVSRFARLYSPLALAYLVAAGAGFVAIESLLGDRQVRAHRARAANAEVTQYRHSRSTGARVRNGMPRTSVRAGGIGASTTREWSGGQVVLEFWRPLPPPQTSLYPGLVSRRG
jgi:hypothetical protein